MPPTTTTTKHSTMISTSMPRVREPMGAMSPPARPASQHPSANTSEYMRGTLMPRAETM